MCDSDTTATNSRKNVNAVPGWGTRSIKKRYLSICRYGVSGRGCSKEHPKPCRKLLQHGTKAPNGCTMGRNKCGKFHPKMYPTSIRKGECFNESCRPKHVIGTKRIPREQPDSETESPETPSNTQANSDFLEALRLLKADHTPPQSLYPVKAPQHKVMCPNNIGSLQQHGSRSIHYKSTALDKPYSTHDAQHDVQHPVAASNATAIQPSGDSVHPRTHDVRTGEHGTCSRDTADANIHGSSTHRTDPLNYCSTWNIQGLRPRTGPSKVPYVRDLLHDHNQMSMVLTET